MSVAHLLDHSILKPTARARDFEEGCEVGLRYGVAAVCVVPFFVPRCAELLAGSDVKVCTTIGFPQGLNALDTKIVEALQSIEDGAEEIDMVVNISKVLDEEWGYVRDDIAGVVEAARDGEAKVKVIFENCYLEDAHKIKLCEICAELDVDWVKTSTGFGTHGATPEDVQLMRTHSPEHIQIKAAGGIRTLEEVLTYQSLGATRIGTSSTESILASQST